MNDIAGIGKIHHPVVYERGGLRHPGLDPPRPGQPHLIDVARIDLVEQPSSVRRQLSQSSGSGFWSTASVTGEKSRPCACTSRLAAASMTTPTSPTLRPILMPSPIRASYFKGEKSVVVRTNLEGGGSLLSEPLAIKRGKN